MEDLADLSSGPVMASNCSEAWFEEYYHQCRAPSRGQTGELPLASPEPSDRRLSEPSRSSDTPLTREDGQALLFWLMLSTGGGLTAEEAETLGLYQWIEERSERR